MKTPAPTPDEPERQAALDALHLVFSPAEERFDRITELARKLFEVEFALVSLVSRDIQWFKSSCGLNADQTSRSVSFCGHAVHQDDTFVVSDALQDPVFADNPLVTGAPYIRFYAGQPLAYRGRHVGTLCIIDTRPRELTEADLISLRQMGAWVEHELQTQLPGSPQTRFLAALDEGERAALLDAAAGAWNETGFERMMAAELANQPSSVLLARICPTGGFDESLESGVLRGVAGRIRASAGPDLILAHRGQGEFAAALFGVERPAAELLLKRLARVLAEDGAGTGPEQPGWRIGAVHGQPGRKPNWADLWDRCRPDPQRPTRILDWPRGA